MCGHSWTTPGPLVGWVSGFGEWEVGGCLNGRDGECAVLIAWPVLAQADVICQRRPNAIKAIRGGPPPAHSSRPHAHAPARRLRPFTVSLLSRQPIIKVQCSLKNVGQKKLTYTVQKGKVKDCPSSDLMHCFLYSLFRLKCCEACARIRKKFKG
jgi:hypothetical protein